MKERLERRLEELKAEFDNGQKLLADLDEQRRRLEQKLLRISGAAQVLEEELNAAQDEKNPVSGPVLAAQPDRSQQASG